MERYRKVKVSSQIKLKKVYPRTSKTLTGGRYRQESQDFNKKKQPIRLSQHTSKEKLYRSEESDKIFS
jgi:hypothetical protein